MGVSGDLDSISEKVKTHFENEHVLVKRDADQNSTDFDKALKETSLKAKEAKCESCEIVALNALQGRLDHTISQINTAYKHSLRSETVDLFLMSEQSLAWVLLPGSHKIHINSCPSQTCGYVPLFGPVRKVSTSGLKYDLTDYDNMCMGGLISTSNSYVSNCVELSLSDPVLWIMNFDLKDPLYWTAPSCNGHTH